MRIWEGVFDEDNCLESSEICEWNFERDIQNKVDGVQKTGDAERYPLFCVCGRKKSLQNGNSLSYVMKTILRR